MASVENLEHIERLYTQVLELTREQEQCLRSGDLAPLSQLLEQKTSALAQAQALTHQILGPAANRDVQGFQEALNRVGAILAQLVSAEDRCQALVPQPPRLQARRQAAAAYGKSSKGR